MGLKYAMLPQPMTKNVKIDKKHEKASKKFVDRRNIDCYMQ
jgi:hypothetical protein